MSKKTDKLSKLLGSYGHGPRISHRCELCLFPYYELVNIKDLKKEKEAHRQWYMLYYGGI